MSAERWRLLSDWHGAWLAADADGRVHLRREIAAEHPELLDEIDALAASSAYVDGFLETPAVMLMARDLATEQAPLTAATMVGPYRVVSLLARGGMGDVYRATDVRLQRDVALKLLAHPDTGDALRVERFLQEARVTASLDHPHIVRVYDVGLYGDRPYLVAELLEGETLRATINRGMLPPHLVLRLAAEIAGGLVVAHAAGLVHRDLKPENIFLTPRGSSKILDFGIAKLAAPDVRGALNTLTGVLLGTAGYLAPEQVHGLAVDGRADLFALGSMLFEMLTGRRAFAREHTIDTLHAIVHEPPPDLLTTRRDLPPTLVAIVMRLLEKQPAARFQSSSDLLWALEHVDAGAAASLEPSPGSSHPGPPAAASPAWRPPWSGVAAAIGIVVAASGWWLGTAMPRRSSPAALTRFAWSLPAGTDLDSPPVVSPDGHSIAFAGVDASGAHLLVRTLDSIEARVIPASEGAKQPFWSPNSQSLGYFARGKLMRVAVAGGTPVVICDAPDGRGGAWADNGTIVFGADFTEAALSRVSIDGGPPQPATVLDLDQSENSHRWPAILPDGIHFLYFVRSSSVERRGVYIGRLDGPPEKPGKPLFRSESEAIYASAQGRTVGVLLSVHDGQIEARRFDARARVLIGEPQAVSLPAGGNTPYHPAMVGASADVLAFESSPVPYGLRFATVNRDGSDLTIAREREPQNWPRVSPDGHLVARQRIEPLAGNPDIWVEDQDRGTRVRVTSVLENDILPVWSPDGRRLAYTTGRMGARHLSVAAADGTGIVAN